jgi:uncharacterized membrane protein
LATLTVIKFPAVGGADGALSKLKGLQTQGLITIHDAAVVSWPEGKKSPKTRQTNDLKGPLALNGAFWGLLFGLLFFVPFLGMAVGAAAGALSGALIDVGIDDNFIKQTRDKITPGTSALFLMSSDAVMDRIQDAFKGESFEIIATNLSKEQEEQLKSVFEE